MMYYYYDVISLRGRVDTVSCIYVQFNVTRLCRDIPTLTQKTNTDTDLIKTFVVNLLYCIIYYNGTNNRYGNHLYLQSIICTLDRFPYIIQGRIKLNISKFEYYFNNN